MKHTADRDADAGGARRGGADQARNFFVYAASHGLTKLGDALMNPKTTLSWLGASLGAPTFLVAMLVPLREAGSLLLQVAIAGWVDRAGQRKWVWVAGALGQGLCVAGMAVVAVAMQGVAAGVVLLALVALFAVARSASSLASKDVLGRSLPADRRGRAGGWAASGAGVATLLAAWGGMLLFDGGQAGEGGRQDIAWLLLLAALTWLLGAAVFAAMREPRDQPARRAAGVVGRLGLLREDARLRRFVLTRSLLLCSALSAPYYVLLAQRHAGESDVGWLGFVLLSGLAGLLGGPLWGRLADRSSRMVLIASAGIAAALGVLVFALERWVEGALDGRWLLPGAFLLLSLAHEGVRIGRKTWVVNIAEGQRRRDYVAVSNSAMGVILLCLGAASAALAEHSLTLVLLVLSLMGAVGAWFARQLPEAESDED